jgi:hypothetical protein
MGQVEVVVPIMNWVYSASARAGLGPPEWIVIAVIFTLLLVAAFEPGGGESNSRTIVLTRKDRWLVTALVSLIVLFIGFAMWR